MRLTLHLSGGLRAILADLSPEVAVDVEGPIAVRDVLILAGINPLLVMVATVDGKRVEKMQVLVRDADIGLVGPMAGG
jgi:hypothetical protein